MTSPNGISHACEGLPSVQQNGWASPSKSYPADLFPSFRPGSLPWQESLIVRPGYEEAGEEDRVPDAAEEQDSLRGLIEVIGEGNRPDWDEYLDVFPTGSLCAHGMHMTYASAASSAWHGSVDAALALCEALLPGWIIRTALGGESPAYAHVYFPRRYDGDPDKLTNEPAKSTAANHDHVAGALLLAVLQAKLKEASHD